VQLCTLPWLGFVPDEVSVAPETAVVRLADRLGVPAVELRGYGERAQTRTGHLREIVRYLGWRPVGQPEWKELDEFLFARAMEHDLLKLLFTLACEFLISERLLRPGVVHLLEHVATAQERGARRETWTVLAHLLVDPARRAKLEAHPPGGRSWMRCWWWWIRSWVAPRWPGWEPTRRRRVRRR
jgi:hypothetical protein